MQEVHACTHHTKCPTHLPEATAHDTDQERRFCSGCLPEKIVVLGLIRTAEQRLAKLLLDWSQGLREDQPKNYVELTLTQEEIAQLIGTTRQTVTRVMSDLKKRNILELVESTLIIRKRSELSGIAAHMCHSGDKDESKNGESI
jgi:Crp-like helix-turn-helix domain